MDRNAKLPIEFMRSVQLFRDLRCILNTTEKDIHVDKDLRHLRVLTDLSEILADLNVDEMMKHILNCLRSLTLVQKKLSECEDVIAGADQDVVVAYNKVFVAAVAATAEELIRENGEKEEALKNIMQGFHICILLFYTFFYTLPPTLSSLFIN
jgi:hypothetical protein